MEKFIKALQEVKEMSDELDSFIGVRLDNHSKDVHLHLDSRNFKKELSELGITHDEVVLTERGCTELPYELSVWILDVKLFVILDESEYKNEFKEWFFNSNDTEHAQAALTEQERKMKEETSHES